MLHSRLRIVWLLIAILSMITPRFANTYLSAQEAAPAKVAAKDSAEKGESLADGAHIVNVQRIWDAAHHNAFTDLIRFHDQWYCVFREGSSHVSPDGALRVIRSTDGKTWTSAALITSEVADLRDAKITVTPDQRLMLSGAAAMHDTSHYKHQSMSWFSDDGENWSEPVEVGERDNWLWRVTWHDGKAYGVGYQTNDSPERLAKLFRSPDGKHYDVIVERLFDQGYPNETSLVFTADDTCYCLLRRDAGSKTGQLGTSQPPYTDWSWKDLGIRIGGPQMIQLPDGRFVAAVRLLDGRTRTSLCWLDPTSGKITEFLTLPSGGDTSYAGLVWHADRLWVSYYSAHEANADFTTAIYFAEVELE
ncbi:MAG: exo-alpha-sialidase [Pirellulaceae bacterium]|nr:exo-alpha-sialidase [Pirellulaceae bacterium]